METKVLTAGIVGFLLGGLVVSIAATQTNTAANSSSVPMRGMSMSEMAGTLVDKQGDAYDEAFIAGMINHHEGAIEMAELSAQRAQHDEVKRLSQQIIVAQKSEIDQMNQWRVEWGYKIPADHPAH